jgi:hypothetical protein
VTAILVAALLSAASACPAYPAQQGHVRSSFVGDVDGDGARDRVFVRVDDWAPARCMLHLVVRRRHGRPLVARLRPPMVSAEANRQLTWPTVAGLAEIDKQRGAEIVATVDAGASTFFLGVFTVRRNRLIRMRIPGYAQTFSSLGSLGYYSGVDCVGDLVVATDVDRTVRPVTVQRRFFRVVGTRFVLVKRRAYSFEWNVPLPRFPGLSDDGPFVSCR